LGSFNLNIRRLKFLELLDTPESFSGEGGKALVVSVSEDGVEFANFPVGVLWGDISGDILLQGDLVYLLVPPTVSLSAEQVFESGYVVPEVVLTWVTGKSMVSRTLSAPVPVGDRELGAGGSGSYTHENADLTVNTTYSLTVSDGVNSQVATQRVLFKPKFYYGASNSEALSNIEVLGLNGFLSNKDTIEFSVNGDGKYVYFLYPSFWGGLDVYVNGQINTAWVFSTFEVTNVHGLVIEYNCFRSAEKQEGDNILIKVAG
jgi:hypothetical protein